MRVLGIDQSYTNFGIALIEGTSLEDAKIIRVKSYPFKGLKTKSEKRAFVRKLVKQAVEKYEPDYIVVERIRQFSQGFLSMTYVKATASLIASVVDTVFPMDVYSVDTRSWKSRVCGGSKGKHKADKGVSVRFIMNKYGMTLNDDQADAVCIALYPLTNKVESLIKNKFLKKEE